MAVGRHGIYSSDLQTPLSMYRHGNSPRQDLCQCASAPVRQRTSRSRTSPHASRKSGAISLTASGLIISRPRWIGSSCVVTIPGMSWML